MKDKAKKVEGEKSPKRKPAPKASYQRVKARKAALAMLNGATQTEAMRQAGYAEHSIEKRNKTAIDAIANEFNRILDDQIPPQMMVEKALQLLNAEHVEAFLDKNTGQIVYAEPRTDNLTQFKSLELLARIRGLIMRTSEVKHTHVIEPSAILAARRRAETVSCDAVVTHALPASTESTSYASNSSDPLGLEPNESEKSEEKANEASDSDPDGALN